MHSRRGPFLWRNSTAYVRRRLTLTLAAVLLLAIIAGIFSHFLKLAIDAQAVVGPAKGPSFNLVITYILVQGRLKAVIAMRDTMFGLAVHSLNRTLNRRLLDHILDLP